MKTNEKAVKYSLEKSGFGREFSELLEKSQEISFAALDEANATDATNLFPAQTFEKLSEAGIINAVMPKKYGGAGLGICAGTTFELLTLLKQLGYGNLVVGRIFEGHFNAWQLIGEYADNAQVERFAASAKRENHLFGVWNTEAGNGVKVSSNGNKFSLEGAKTFASGVGFVNRPIVTGRLENGGWQMFVAPLDEISTTIDDSFWKPLGMKSSRSFRVDFSGTKISSDNLIGAADDYYRQPFFSGGAIRFAAVQLGAAELLFDLTRDFLRELNRTNDPFQQMRLGKMAIAVESGNLWLKGAAKVFDEFLAEKKDSQIEIVIQYAGMMRTAIEQICQNVMVSCERAIGSRGLLQPYAFERVIRDLTIYLRQAAPDAAVANIGAFALKSEAQNYRLWKNNER